MNVIVSSLLELTFFISEKIKSAHVIMTSTDSALFSHSSNEDISQLKITNLIGDWKYDIPNCKEIKSFLALGNQVMALH